MTGIGDTDVWISVSSDGFVHLGVDERFFAWSIREPPKLGNQREGNPSSDIQRSNAVTLILQLPPILKPGMSPRFNSR